MLAGDEAADDTEYALEGEAVLLNRGLLEDAVLVELEDAVEEGPGGEGGFSGLFGVEGGGSCDGVAHKVEARISDRDHFRDAGVSHVLAGEHDRVLGAMAAAEVEVGEGGGPYFFFRGRRGGAGLLHALEELLIGLDGELEEKGLAVPEMVVGGGSGDADFPGNFAEREAFQTGGGGEFQGGVHNGAAEVPMVVFRGRQRFLGRHVFFS